MKLLIMALSVGLFWPAAQPTKTMDATTNERPIEYLPIRWYEGPNPETKYGEKFDVNALCFASNSLPWNSEVDVTYNNITLRVRCNDRGPNRVELTRGAFERFAKLDVGVLRNAKVTRIK